MRESRNSSNSSRSSSSRPPQRNASSSRQGTNWQDTRTPSARQYDGRSYDSRGSTPRPPSRRPDGRSPRKKRRRRSPLIFILPLILVIALIFLFKSCAGGKDKISNYPLEFSSESMVVGDTAQASLKDLPADKADKVVWSSSDTNVVEIDKAGKLTAKKAGTATIVANLNGDSQNATMLVKKPTPNVLSVALDYENVTIVSGDTFQLSAKVMVEDGATAPAVSWTTSDPSVVRVTGDGLLTAGSPGVAIVVATAGIQSTTCNITVEQKGNKSSSNPDKSSSTSDNSSPTSDKSSPTSDKSSAATTPSATEDSAKKISPTHVTLSKNLVTLAPKETVTLKATVSPSGADQRAVVWSSSDPNVATVSDGVVTAKAKGSATITAKAGEQSTDCTITVSEK